MNDLVAQVFRQIIAKPRVHVIAKRALFEGVIEIHGHAAQRPSW